MSEQSDEVIKQVTIDACTALIWLVIAEEEKNGDVAGEMTFSLDLPTESGTVEKWVVKVHRRNLEAAKGEG